jgi:hypothetical protein
MKEFTAICIRRMKEQKMSAPSGFLHIQRQLRITDKLVAVEGIIPNYYIYCCKLQLSEYGFTITCFDFKDDHQEHHLLTYKVDQVR